MCPCTEPRRRRSAPSTRPGLTPRSSGGYLNIISSLETRSQVNPSQGGWGTSCRISSPPQTTSWPWSYSDPRKLWWRKEFDRKPSVTGSSILAPASGRKPSKTQTLKLLILQGCKCWGWLIGFGWRVCCLTTWIIFYNWGLPYIQFGISIFPSDQNAPRVYRIWFEYYQISG